VPELSSLDSGILLYKEASIMFFFKWLSKSI
jgi:hypothetical protein